MKFKNKGFCSSALVVSLLSSTISPYTVFGSSGSTLTDSQLNKLQEESKLDVTVGDQIDPLINTSSTELVKVIVELKEEPISLKTTTDNGFTSYKAYSSVETEHTSFKKFFNGLVATAKTDSSTNSTNLKNSEIGLEYYYALNGLSLSIPGTDVAKLLESGVVKKVWKDVEFKIDDPIVETTSVQESSSSMMDSLGIVNVDQLHSEGVTGRTKEGVAIKVGVIDTGIDYNHPDLTEVYEGSREDSKSSSEVKGWDFVDGDSDPMETTYKDWLDALAEFGETGAPEIYGTSTYYTTHGTHVSGTIAGNRGSGSDNAVLGVAPDVDLYGYRALGPYGAGAASWIIGAIDKSVADDMDVVNMSLGAEVNSPLYVTSTAVNNAVTGGVTFCIAAGNSGSDGEMSLGSPGTAPLAITVGASTFDIAIPTVTTSYTKADGTIVSFENSKMMGTDFSTAVTSVKDLDVVYVGLGSTDEIAATDVKGKVALITRGTYALVDKIKNVKEAGAVAAIMINNIDGEIQSYSGSNQKFCPTYQISKADGEAFVDYLANGGTLKVTFTNPAVSVSDGDELAGFSSRGPVGVTYDIKPDVVAPGVSIFSSVTGEPVLSNEGTFTGEYDYQYAYERESGTSMATPHVAGIAALILSVHPEYTPADVKAVLSNTSVALKDKTLSVFEQGAGRVDAYEAVKTNVFIKSKDQRVTRDYASDLATYTEKTIEVERGSLNFGVASEEGDVTLTKNMSIENRGTKAKNFDVKVVFHDSRTGVSGTEDILSAVDNNLKLTVPSTLTVESKETKNFNVELFVPQTAELGKYEGYIYFTDKESNKTYPVPFAFSSAKAGISAYEINKITVQSGGENWEYTNRAVGTGFVLGTVMDKLTWYLEDENGEPIGYIGVVNATPLKTNVAYTINYLFTGTVYKFENNTSNEETLVSALVPTGYYNVVMQGRGANGKIYEEKRPLYVDNSPAKLTVSRNGTVLKDGVYEVEDSDFVYGEAQINGNDYSGVAYWIDIEVKDKGIENLYNKYGYDVDQSDNTLYFYSFPYTSQALKRYGSSFPLDEYGKTRFGLEQSDFIYNGKTDAVITSFANADMANNVTYSHLAFVKKGTKYLDLNVLEDSIQKDDTATLLVNVNNVDYLNKIAMPVIYNGTIFELESIEFADPTLAAKANDPTLTGINKPVISYTISGKGTAAEQIDITANNLLKNRNLDLDLLKLKFKVKSDELYYSKTVFKTSSAKYDWSQSALNNGKNVPIDSFLQAFVNFSSKNTRVRGMLFPQAISKYDSNTLSVTATKDLLTVGAKVYALGEDGTRYDGTILDSSGTFEIRNIPADGKSYYVYTEVPGHLTTYQQIFSGIDLNDETTDNLQGQYINVGIQNSSYAGDVNDDGVIDALDAEAVIEAYKFRASDEYNPADFNLDGVVDSTDLRFVEKNFGKSEINTKAEPQSTFGDKNLDYYLRRVGLVPVK